MANARDIGVDVQMPQQECSDPHCPFHGGFSVRGQIIDGQVVSTKMERTARVERSYTHYIPKYERFEKRTSSYTAHSPACLNVEVGDVVKIMECRPVSKTKAFVIVESKRGNLRLSGDDATAPAKPAGVEEESE